MDFSKEYNISVHLTEEQLNKRIAEIGADITEKYKGQSVYLICILKGSIFFTTELAKRSTGKTIYILDEPTTGLHTADVEKLIEVLQRLVDAGNTVLVIEHNLDIIKIADHIIDLGPEGGDMGGEIVATGTPEEVAQCERSYTGKYLKDKLTVS